MPGKRAGQWGHGGRGRPRVPGDAGAGRLFPRSIQAFCHRVLMVFRTAYGLALGVGSP